MADADLSYELNRLGHIVVGEGEVADAELLATIDNYLARIRELQEEEQEILDIALKRKDDIDRWAELKVQVPRTTRQYLQGIVQRVALLVSFRRGKSYALPNGKIGRRQLGGNLRIAGATTEEQKANRAAAVRWAKENGLPIKVKEDVEVDTLKAWFREHGELPPGCEVAPEKEEPYVEVG